MAHSIPGIIIFRITLPVIDAPAHPADSHAGKKSRWLAASGLKLQVLVASPRPVRAAVLAHETGQIMYSFLPGTHVVRFSGTTPLPALSEFAVSLKR